MNKNFCNRPWTAIFIYNDGYCKPCCIHGKSYGTNIKEYLNSKELVKLKEEFLSGKQPKECFRCWNNEASGAVSNRRPDATLFSNSTEHFINTVAIPLGNTCNLACRICEPKNSTTWGTESLKTKGVLI